MGPFTIQQETVRQLNPSVVLYDALMFEVNHLWDCTYR